MLPPPIALARRDRLGCAPICSRRSASSAVTFVAARALPVADARPLIAWATTSAVWSAPDGALCRAHQDGACWAFIARKLDYFRYGSYPQAERWRVDRREGDRRRR